jgi:hypothetical protein
MMEDQTKRMSAGVALWIIARLVEPRFDDSPFDYSTDRVVELVAERLQNLEIELDDATRRITDLEKWLAARTEKLRQFQQLRKASVNCGTAPGCSLLCDSELDDLFENED